MATKFTIHLVAGARPNFMKIAPLYHQLKKEPWCEVSVVATGQHYSPELSDVFFKEFSLPKPDFHLGVGEGGSKEQLNKITEEYGKVLSANKPNLVVVVGDVTSTLAGCLAAKKMGIKVAHVEAGLRSRDLSMPEERNRIEVDKVAELLFAPSQDAVKNLLDEGRKSSDIFLVGNIMIDALCLVKGKIDQFSKENPSPFRGQNFALVTLHRPSNVDEKLRLSQIVENLINAADSVPLVFPVHPRTEKRLKEFGLWEKLSKCPEKIRLMAPLGYIEFMSYLERSLCAITDSGGIQEETTYLNIPCFTLRKNSERPVTMKQGSNKLIEPEHLVEELRSCLSNPSSRSEVPDLWDGKTACRVVKVITDGFGP